MAEALWMEVHDIVQEAVNKTIPKKKKYRKAKWFSVEALQIAVKKKQDWELTVAQIMNSLLHSDLNWRK